MVVIEIEDKDGSSIGAFRVCENNINGEVEITDFEPHISTDKNIGFADTDGDYFFDTNEELLRIQLEYEEGDTIKNPFRSGNHIGFYHEKDDVVNLVQELASYKAVLKSFNKGDYRDCGVLIENYFGHIDYWYHFGYNKTHAEIVSILYSNLLSQITGEKIEGYYKGDSSFFTDFCNRQINKIISRLQNDYDIEDVDQLMKDNWLP